MSAPVTARTRAPREGRDIVAPCGRIERVYHFAWAALICRRCSQAHEKADYRIAP
jgi:hypothetical protein